MSYDPLWAAKIHSIIGQILTIFRHISKTELRNTNGNLDRKWTYTHHMVKTLTQRKRWTRQVSRPVWSRGICSCRTSRELVLSVDDSSMFHARAAACSGNGTRTNINHPVELPCEQPATRLSSRNLQGYWSEGHQICDEWRWVSNFEVFPLPNFFRVGFRGDPLGDGWDTMSRNLGPKPSVHPTNQPTNQPKNVPGKNISCRLAKRRVANYPAEGRGSAVGFATDWHQLTAQYCSGFQTEMDPAKTAPLYPVKMALNLYSTSF